MRYLLPITLALAPVLAAAETTFLNLDTLPGKTVYDSATMTPLALTKDGAPLVITLHLEAGQVVPPHATSSELRLLSVLSGDLFWGDGDTADPAAETVYPAGSFLVIKPGDTHWLAARKGDLRVQLVVLDEDALTPDVKEQIQ